MFVDGIMSSDWNENVSLVTAVNGMNLPLIGSVDLGYVLVAVLLSIAHVKDNALSAIVSVLEVDNK